MRQEDREEAKRFLDLYRRSQKQGTFNFTGFLNRNQSSILFEMEAEIKKGDWKLYGGYSEAERVMARFGNPDELGYEEDFPISCLFFAPANPKFAQEIGHRDVLGAIMNLGIERSLIGDIRFGNQKIYLYCAEHIGEYICSEITRIGRTVIITGQAEHDQVLESIQFEENNAIIASTRIDVLVAYLCKLSRKSATELLLGKNVFVNGKVCDNFSYQIKDNDVISIRGYGKIIFDGVTGQTKKDRMKIQYRKYI